MTVSQLGITYNYIRSSDTGIGYDISRVQPQTSVARFHCSGCAVDGTVLSNENPSCRIRSNRHTTGLSLPIADTLIDEDVKNPGNMIRCNNAGLMLGQRHCNTWDREI